MESCHSIASLSKGPGRYLDILDRVFESKTLTFSLFRLLSNRRFRQRLLWWRADGEQPALDPTAHSDVRFGRQQTAAAAGRQAAAKHQVLHVRPGDETLRHGGCSEVAGPHSGHQSVLPAVQRAWCRPNGSVAAVGHVAVPGRPYRLHAAAPATTTAAAASAAAPASRAVGLPTRDIFASARLVQVQGR